MVAKNNTNKRSATFTGDTASALVPFTTTPISTINNTQSSLATRPVGEFFFDIARGKVPDIAITNVAATSGVITTTEKLIAPVDGVVFPTVTETLRVRAGGNAADSIVGTGAQLVLVIGLDATYAAIQDVIVLNGAAASGPTTLSFFRVQSAQVIQTGTGQTNAGIITIENTTTLETVEIINVGTSISQTARFTVPSGTEVVLSNIQGSVDSTKATTIKIFGTVNSLTGSPTLELGSFLNISGAFNFDIYPYFFAFPAITDFFVTAFVGSGSGGVTISWPIFFANV